MNLNAELNKYVADNCNHPEGGIRRRLVCKTCAIAYAERRALDEVETLFQVITDETGHLTLASLLNEFKSLKEHSD